MFIFGRQNSVRFHSQLRESRKTLPAILMERLHANSSSTSGKFILPLIFIMTAIFVIVFFINLEFWQGAVIASMIMIILAGVFKNFYWDLKRVYLEEENNRLVIIEKREEIWIEFSEIENVELVRILSTLIVVKLKSEINNISEFTFAPKSYFIFKNPIEEKLNKLINHSTAGNRRFKNLLVFW